MLFKARLQIALVIIYAVRFCECRVTAAAGQAEPRYGFGTVCKASDAGRAPCGIEPDGAIGLP